MTTNGNAFRRAISYRSGQIGSLFLRLSEWVYQSPQQKRAIPWFRDQGDSTHRLDYDLDHSSVVVDLGGYRGQWASDIHAKYCCKIYVYEAVPEFAMAIRARFAKNPLIQVCAVGVSGCKKDSLIHLAADSSSSFGSGGQSRPISLIDAAQLCNHCGHDRIDLIKINIEGEEYDVLDRLIDVGLTRSFRNIQVQFHDFVPDAAERMKNIQEKLRTTHRLTYQYEFVWENWEAVTWPP